MRHADHIPQGIVSLQKKMGLKTFKSCPLIVLQWIDWQRERKRENSKKHFQCADVDGNRRGFIFQFCKFGNVAQTHYYPSLLCCVVWHFQKPKPLTMPSFKNKSDSRQNTAEQ
ncbi:hypothetical protein AMECASPLE_006048 [Ameca splendens]|uniref:Uncharacterized protein n=1 Tax=Ameca splendens TaxID=208324 RepID=A0ABV0XCC6_9TELE